MKISAGYRAGRLVTIEHAGRAADGHVVWRCRCDCGTYCLRQTNNLRSKKLQSCGCAASDLQKVHGMRGTPTYSSWIAAKRRCHDARHSDYPQYGARGIFVCERWRQSFEAFLEDMGPRPEGTTLDRYPNGSGNYEPGNCRWATPQQQSRNRRTTTFVLWGGKSVPLPEVAELLGISTGAAHMRLKRGTLHDRA